MVYISLFEIINNLISFLQCKKGIKACISKGKYLLGVMKNVSLDTLNPSSKKIFDLL